MPDDKFVFDQDAVDLIRQVVHRVLSESYPQLVHNQRRGFINYTSMIGLADNNGITEGSGSTPGGGTISYQKIENGSLTPLLDQDDQLKTDTVRNLGGYIPGAKYVHIDHDRFGTPWVINGMCQVSPAKVGSSGITAMNSATGEPGFGYVYLLVLGAATVEDPPGGPVLKEVRSTLDRPIAGSSSSRNKYVMVGRTNDGVWWIIEADTDTLFRFTLTEDLGATTSGEASADIKLLDGTAYKSDQTVEDPIGMFAGLADTQKGYCYFICGRFFIVQAECPTGGGTG